MEGKRYYKIGEVSKITGVKDHVLRYWEKEFKHVRPRRIRGQRLYTEKDLETIKTIKRLLYQEGLKISGVKKRLDAREKVGKDQVPCVCREIKEALLEVVRILNG